MRLWRAVEAVAVGLWLGAMAGFGALVAPLLFQMLPSRSLAGDVAGAAIRRIDWAGAVLGLLAVVALVRLAPARPLRWARLVLILGMIGVAIANETYVRGKLDAVERQMTRQIEEYAPGDPLRLEFDRWHRTSVNLWGINMAIGAVVLGWAAAEGGEARGREGRRGEARQPEPSGDGLGQGDPEGPPSGGSGV